MRIAMKDPISPVCQRGLQVGAALSHVNAQRQDGAARATCLAEALIPDVCPAGPGGAIPVGGVVAACNAIRPELRSADICWSAMVTEFPDAAPKRLLDSVPSATHSGQGGRLWCGRIDTSKPPPAYMSAAAVRARMQAYGPAEPVGEVLPCVSITAGDREHDAPRRRKARAGAAPKAAEAGAA